jgi:hypothetical protein
MHPSQHHQAGAHLAGFDWSDLLYLSPVTAVGKGASDLIQHYQGGEASGGLPGLVLSPVDPLAAAAAEAAKPPSVPFWAYAVGGLAIGGALVYFMSKANKGR